MSEPSDNRVEGGITGHGAPQLIQSSIGQLYISSHTATLERPPQPSSTVPFSRDADFIDHGGYMQLIQEKMLQPSARVALVGFGGVGKSQLAIEYSHRITVEKPDTWIFWVHASNVARFEESYQAIADRAKIPGREDRKHILKLVYNWLCDPANGKWTMIVDNADNAKLFSVPAQNEPAAQLDRQSLPEGTCLLTFLPPVHHGPILITSRDREAAVRITGGDSHIIIVHPMNHVDASTLLDKKLTRRNVEQNTSQELLSALEYMPLAITQAAAYINQRSPRISVQKYLEIFQKDDHIQISLLMRNEADVRRDNRDGSSNSALATWQISFERIREEKPSAAKLLSLMSFLDKQGIPEFLIMEGYRNITREEDSQENIDQGFEDDLNILRRYSLISLEDDEATFKMHRLVQLSTRKWLEVHNELEKWRQSYIEMISKAFPSGEFETWTVCQKLYPHTQNIFIKQPATNNFLIQRAKALTNIAFYDFRRGHYSLAEDYLRLALVNQTDLLGKEHPDTLTNMSYLALVLRARSKFQESEKINRTVLARREKMFGEEHHDTLTSMNNLAMNLQGQYKYQESEEINRTVLVRKEKILGKEHPDTLTSMNNLALDLKYQGKYQESEEINRTVLARREKMFGEEHPNTLTSMNNLALDLQYQGKYQESEEINRTVLARREKMFGEEHPNTLSSMHNLASDLHYQGKYQESVQINRTVLARRGKMLGKEHPNTLASMSNLAVDLYQQGKYQESEDMFGRALEGYERILGKEHPKTLRLKQWLLEIEFEKKNRESLKI